MKFLRASIAILAIMVWSGVALAQECESVAAAVTTKVEADPESVLLIVEDAMRAHDKCACEVVKAAIVAARATEELVGEIVFTAVIASESMAPTVAECAISVAPDSASQIRSALKRALSDAGSHSSEDDGGKVVVSGKNPSYGKEPIPPAEPVREFGFDFGSAPLDVRGILSAGPVTWIRHREFALRSLYRRRCLQEDYQDCEVSGSGHWNPWQWGRR